jgi:putative oxidoreductase
MKYLAQLKSALQLSSPWLQSVWLLLARLWMAQVFFLAGLTKIRDWDTTLLFFTEEYRVPLLPPALAAVMGTGGELILPVLLVLGLAGRFAALGLFVVNAMAVISYPGLAGVALELHGYWAMLIAAVVVFGSGRFSADYVLRRYWQRWLS